MKNALFALCLLVTFTAGAQDFVAPAPRTQRPVRVVPRRNLDGAAVRMARSGAPLQMLNPRAPKEFGDGTEFVSEDANDPFINQQDRRPRKQTLTLFAFAW